MPQIKYSVLLVDDDPSDQELVATYLEKAPHTHYSLKCVDTFEAAREEVENGKNHYDVAIIDYLLNGHSGLDLLKHLEVSGIPTVVLTGHGDMRLDQLALQLGAADYIPKSKITEDLLDLSLRHSIERKRNQALVLRQQKEVDKVVQKVALSELATTIIHEINNPLAVIQAKLARITNLLNNPQPDAAEISKSVDVATQMIYRIIKIKDGVRRIYGGQKTSQYERSNLLQVIHDAVTICEKKVQMARTELSLNVPPDLDLECHPVEISQMLTNLICNACDAIERLEDRKISVGAEKSILNGQPAVKIYVEDSGPTPSAEIREKMFKDFFTTKGADRGTGVGLSVSRRIARWHHGSLEIDPNSKNTRFIIQLPVNPELQKQKTYKFLIVDDEKDIADLLAQELRSAHFTVNTAHDGHDAIQLLQKEDYDIVITDLHMPGMDGLQLYEAATELSQPKKSPMPEFFFITGHAPMGLLGKALEERTFYKPFNVKELIQSAITVAANVGADNATKLKQVENWVERN